MRGVSSKSQLASESLPLEQNGQATREGGAASERVLRHSSRVHRITQLAAKLCGACGSNLARAPLVFVEAAIGVVRRTVLQTRKAHCHFCAKFRFALDRL